MQRYRRIMLGAEEETSIGVSRKQNPPILRGYKAVLGTWADGFVIERISDGSQFVWVPVGTLRRNGTADVIRVDSKFGRRNFCGEKFFPETYYDCSGYDMFFTQNSVNRYGGFYISRFLISKNENGSPQSIKGEMPWTNLNFNLVARICSIFETTDGVTSHLPYGTEHDCLLEWLIESRAKSFAEIAEDSTKWGNHWNTQGAPRRIVETGSRENWSANHIYDIAGNTCEWTQEKTIWGYPIVRGSSYLDNGSYFPAAYRYAVNPLCKRPNAGFRIVLRIDR